jgi:hypothetical protein
LEEVVEVSREPFPQVSFSVRPGEVSSHQTDEKKKNLLVLGRTPELNDRAIPHGTVSSQHAQLAFNERANGSFEANTWYLQPIKDNPNGTHVDGKPLTKGQWAALRAGMTVRLGGVPMLVTVGIDHSISLTTLPPAAPKPVPGAASSGARPAAPLPPPPMSVRHAARPPHFEKNGDGVRVIDLNDLDDVTLVSGSVLDTPDSPRSFVTVKGQPKSAKFISELGTLIGGDSFVTVRRQGNGLRVENPQKKKSITIHPPGAPREGIEIKPGGLPQDVPGGMVVVQYNGRSYRFRSETP